MKLLNNIINIFKRNFKKAESSKSKILRKTWYEPIYGFFVDRLVYGYLNNNYSQKTNSPLINFKIYFPSDNYCDNEINCRVRCLGCRGKRFIVFNDDTIFSPDDKLRIQCIHCKTKFDLSMPKIEKVVK